jgi:flagellar basal-body rod protein FlgB
MSAIFDTTMRNITRSLDVHLDRHNILSSNVANLDTDSYIPKDIDFKTELKKAADRDNDPLKPKKEVVSTNFRHIQPKYRNGDGPFEPEVFTDQYKDPDAKGNGVDIDREMVKLAENNIRYETSIRMIQHKLTLLKTAIKSGGA